MGAEEHRGIWRRRKERHDLWRIGRFVERQYAGGDAAREGPLSSSDRRERRVVWSDGLLERGSGEIDGSLKGRRSVREGGRRGFHQGAPGSARGKAHRRFQQ